MKATTIKLVNVYYVYVIELNGKHHAFYNKQLSGNNFINLIDNLRDQFKQPGIYKPEIKVTALNFTSSYSGARELANFWNTCYKDNNTYANFNYLLCDTRNNEETN